MPSADTPFRSFILAITSFSSQQTFALQQPRAQPGVKKSAFEEDKK
jgi:hypothetical protein